ncbi:PREDICTED: muscle M-line assembly protein unc-89 [Ceratosolen solmsi marchali]|uniref:Muscle M-line assembly protein unc-89 n=1 Tax=Ceratosolen solmsi marchali TaxID=326594 RepID=A0AAJ6YD25_9HYME|nr:PREDICTED: muscle M-line assembly protein unc-89 [Ceratosolen solmsi marchali]
MKDSEEASILECMSIGNSVIEDIQTHERITVNKDDHVKIRADVEAAKCSIGVLEAPSKDEGKYEVRTYNAASETKIDCDVPDKVKPVLQEPRETESPSIFEKSKELELLPVIEGEVQEPKPTPVLIQVKELELPPIQDMELKGPELPLVRDLEPRTPRIQLPLKDLSIVEGASTRLDCIIVGQPEPEVIWYHDDRPVKESADFQLLFQGDRCSLVMHEAFLDDAGIYKVVAINAGGEASSECTLSITPRAVEATESSPKFVKLLTDLLIAEGEETVFECEVIGEPKPAVIWQLNSDTIIENERVKIFIDENGRNILRISPTTPEDKGNYTAKATNRVGEAKSFAKLVVKVLGDFQRKDDVVQMEEKFVPPYFKEKFESRTVPEGITTKFECIVIGKPAPKIQWLFNDRPVHGKDFLVSVSGDRQVLTIPEVADVHRGNISCIAENAAGKVTCEATIEVGGGITAVEGNIETIQVPDATTEMQASSNSHKYFTSEKTTDEGGLSDSQTLTKTSSSITESSTMHSTMKKEYVTTTSSSKLSSCPLNPTNLCMKKTTHSSENSNAYNGAAPVVQSQKIEEYERIVQDAPGEIRQEKTIIVTQDSGGTKQRECKHQIQVQKPCRKQTAPRFVTPITGMIVDQGSNIVLEGIVDGFPQPVITWAKNGQELLSKNGFKVSYDHNHVKLEIRDVTVKDAGRYTCTARNDVGNSSSTADLVVKKTIFPPVFGRRLQAQVVKKGDRVIMEVEITGTPEPTVTWYKDDEPLIKSEFRMKQQGNCYFLLIDKAEKDHAGKYMVQATNAGGEAQSIADFAVFEPTPDTMVEMHKTLVYENVQDKNARKLCCGQPTEIPGANLTTEQITTTMIQPSAEIKTPFPSTSSSSTIRTIKSEVTDESQKVSRSEMISSSIESHRSETKSEQKFHMKLEHKPAPFDASQKDEQIQLNNSNYNIIDGKSEIIENENIETSSMARKDALSFFESISKGSDSFSKAPREMIKLTNEDDGTGPGCDVRVEQLTKNYERSTKFEEASQELPKPDIQAGKKGVQEIFNKFQKGSSSRGIDNTMFDFPYEEHKLSPLQCSRTILEDVTASGSPIHGTLTISKLEAQSESAEAMLKGFNLIPEPPPEIGYAPKPDEHTKRRPDVSIKAKQLQESFASYSSVDAPIGGVKIFPSSVPPPVRSKTPETIPECSFSIPPPFELDKNIIEDTCNTKKFQEKKNYDGYSSSTSAEALTMEKSWAHKSADSSKKSWPPQQKTSFTDKQEWSLPEQSYKVSSSESKHEIELKPEYRCTQTTIESSSSLEKKSFGSKEIHVTENKIIPPASPPKPEPIIYNAETIKVGHTVNTVEEKLVTEKYIAECGVQQTETTEKKYESTKKQNARPWPDGSDLKAPALVKKVIDYSKPSIKLYHEASSIDLQPGTPPELAYTPGPYMHEKKIEKRENFLEKSLDRKAAFIPTGGVRTIPSIIHERISRDKIYTPTEQSQPTDVSNKYLRSSFYSESDYESEVDNTLKSYVSDNEQCTNGYRRVKAPVYVQPCRPKSTELQPIPPSNFDIPSVITPTVSDSSIKKLSSNYQKDFRYQETSSQSQQYDILPKPGSPPIYVQPTKPTPKIFKHESPIMKTKVLQQESGYMADTDEPLHLQQHKSFSESKASFMETKSYSNAQQKKEDTLSLYSQTHSYSTIPKHNIQRTSFVEKIIEKSPQQQFRTTPLKDKSQVSQCSSRFSKGEFRESDYESDYDSSKISSLWKSQNSAQTVSDTKTSSSSKSMKSSISSSGKSSAPPLSFTKTMKETVTKKESLRDERPRPKSASFPDTPPEIIYEPQKQSYYEGRSGVPYHNAVGTEMKKTVCMDESTENTRRIVTVEQTSRVIKFGENQVQHEINRCTGPTGGDQQKKSSYNVPTPTKFIQGHFRESDYESDVETRKIRAKWAPSESETEEPQYRKVQPPKTRTCKSPIVTWPSDSEIEKSESERRSTHIQTINRQQQMSEENYNLKPGSPPEFGYAPAYEFKKSANHIATKHISNMTSSFKSKTEQFASEIQSDLKKHSKPILKQSMSTDVGSVTDGGDEPRTYREESRVAQYGSKHIDPDTGLIYFKYDFGYEFGVVLPGESKHMTTNHSQSYKNNRKPSDIEVPIIHEFTYCKENGFGKDKNYQRKSVNKFGKSVKWEPTSESEYSEVEDFKGLGHKVPISSSFLIPTSSPSPKWDPISPSPVSLSPSLPSLSPHFGGGPSSNVESTSGSPWSTTNGERIIPVTTEVVKPYIEILPKKAPLFITPLRDIAVINRQTARFECIVQAEPQPNIIWSKDGRIVENSFNAEVHYRNGVCRLTLPQTTPEDAGTYACTATNGLGSSVTSATLQVSGNRRSIYGI